MLVLRVKNSKMRKNLASVVDQVCFCALLSTVRPCNQHNSSPVLFSIYHEKFVVSLHLYSAQTACSLISGALQGPRCSQGRHPPAFISVQAFCVCLEIQFCVRLFSYFLNGFDSLIYIKHCVAAPFVVPLFCPDTKAF